MIRQGTLHSKVPWQYSHFKVELISKLILGSRTVISMLWPGQNVIRLYWVPLQQLS
jgi:membrane-anchored protein YejM (alkaline phosphatase superfamily)